MNGQYFSESAFIAASESAPKRGTAYAGGSRQGRQSRYARDRTDVGAMIPDYRGGISYTKGFGTMLAARRRAFRGDGDGRRVRQPLWR